MNKLKYGSIAIGSPNSIARIEAEINDVRNEIEREYASKNFTLTRIEALYEELNTLKGKRHD